MPALTSQPISVAEKANDSSAQRAELLFRKQQDEIYRGTDRLFMWLMPAQWMAAILFALLFTPTTWAGQESAVHVHVWAAIFLGGALTIFPVWMTYAWPGAAITRHVIAVAQMLMSALLISLTGGRIETHFHVFASLVILSFYRDWRVLIPATIVVGLDHFLRGIYWPYSVYGVLAASPWRSMEHAAWVAFEDVFLVASCFRSIREMRSIATRTAALEASEQSSRQIFEDAPIGMAVVGLDERFRQVNSTFCQMLGYDEKEFMDRTPLDVTHPGDVEESKRLALAMLVTPKHGCMEKRYIRKNGDVLWARRTGCMIHDEDGEPRHFLIMVEDISERKRAEENLRERTTQLQAAVNANQLIMDNSLDVICTVDEQGRFLTVNAACTQLWGFAPDELIGRRYIDLVHPDDQPRTLATQHELTHAGKLNDFVNRYIRKDGAIVDVSWSATWSESARTFFAVAHDVTERAKMEKALQAAKDEADRANRAKSEFLSRMSHELRTPLNAILGFGQLLERQGPAPTQRNHIRHITTAGRHLLDLINEVLDISRIETGKLQLSLEPVGIAAAIAEALELMRPLAANYSVDLIVRSEADAPAYVLADRQRLKQVLLNLLTNGVKYTPPRGKVKISHHASANGTVRLQVRDNGPGISEDNLSRVFTPFDRLGAEQSTVEGTGLGLALCQRLVHAMQGKIGIESMPGQGSTFWVEFSQTDSPIAAAGTARNRSVRSTEQQGGDADDEAKQSHTLLYIEDNPSNLELVEEVLQEKPSIKLLTATTGRFGIHLARQHLPDVILLDLHLPDIAGWEVLAELHEDPVTQGIPVIVVSADATEGQIRRLLSAGARAYLTKPLDIEEFFRVVNELLDSKHDEQIMERLEATAEA